MSSYPAYVVVDDADDGAMEELSIEQASLIADQKTPWCCERCAFWLQNHRVRGFRLPALLGVLASLVLPEMDAASDWLVTHEFYEDGDAHWFRVSLTILLVSGGVATLGLAMTFAQKGVGTKCCNYLSKSCCGNLALLLLAALIAVPGLAPVAAAGLMLYQGKDADYKTRHGWQMMSLKAAELVLEALPQSILQAYVAVSYGKLNPSDQEHFSQLLCFSISISLLGAGSTSFMVEATARNYSGSALQMQVGSRYGITTVLLRACQTGMLVFWIALMVCARKGFAIIAAVVSLVVYIGTGLEATFGRGIAARLTFREHDLDGVALCLPSCCGLLNDERRVLRAIVSNTLPLLTAGGVASAFWTVEHVDNNYANRTVPIGPPGSPQHFDCRERTSGIYPAVFFSAMSLVLMLLSVAMDPVIGVRWLRGKSVQENWEEQYEKDCKEVLREVLEERGQALDSDVGRLSQQKLLELLEEDGSTWRREPQIHALWQWADKAQQGSLGIAELERLASELGLQLVRVLQLLRVCTTEYVQLAEWHALEAALEAGAFDGTTLSEADFRTACYEGDFVEEWRWKLRLLDEIHAVWQWADEAQQGSLGKAELKSLAGEVGWQAFHQLKVCTTDGKPASECVARTEWDDSKHGEGTAVMRRSDGRRGVIVSRLSTQLHGGGRRGGTYGNIRIKFDDDGSVSSWIQTDKVQAIEWHGLEAALEAGAFDGTMLFEADFRTACHEGDFVEAWRRKLQLPDTTVDQAFEAAVRQRKIDAVWRWADTVADGTLQKEELERLGDASDSSPDFNRVCSYLGVQPAEDVAVTKAEFAAARYHERQLWAEKWFHELRLPLLPVEAGCLDFFCAC